jgi:osmotically inducible lipoprotein OsmB
LHGNAAFAGHEVWILDQVGNRIDGRRGRFVRITACGDVGRASRCFSDGTIRPIRIARTRDKNENDPTRRLVAVQESYMKTTLASLCIALALAGCGSMTHREQGTVIGAGVGAAAGAAITGDALGTVGGAAVGGVIGNQIAK